MNDGLREDQRALLHSIFEAQGWIKRVILIGSRAHGDFHDRSDLDFAIEGENVALNLWRLRVALEEDTNIPYRFDLIDSGNVSDAALRSEIEQAGVEFWVNESAASRAS